MDSNFSSKKNQADLLAVSRTLGEIRNLLIEISLALKDELFIKDVAMREEINQQSQSLLRQFYNDHPRL